MKKTIKRIGKCFIVLKQEDISTIGQSVLIVDDGYSRLGYLNSGIAKIRNYFPKGEISILTFEERKFILQKDFPVLRFILPLQRLRPKKYQIALRMSRMRKEEFNFIVLFSLDIMPIIVSLLFFKAKKAKVVLYNQWGQLWSLRLKNISEIFKAIYIKKKTRFSFKEIIKRAGLFFVLFQREDEKALRHSILVVDNGYALFEHAGFAIPKIKEFFPYAKISILALEYRERLFKKNFPGVEIIFPHNCIIKRYRIARHMLRLRKNRYDYIILLSLDITPIIVTTLFIKGKVLLYNQWYQWWSLKPKSEKSYLMTIPQFIFNILIFVYLLISVFWIFLKHSFNVFRFGLTGKRG